MSDLVTFVRARLDEDEQVARNAERYPPGQNDGGAWHQVALLTPWDTRVDEHVARHDPARVLREVEAKRGILAEQVRQLQDDSTDETATWMLQYLASVWAEHPDYQAGWSP